MKRTITKVPVWYFKRTCPKCRKISKLKLYKLGIKFLRTTDPLKLRTLCSCGHTSYIGWATILKNPPVYE